MAPSPHKSSGKKSSAKASIDSIKNTVQRTTPIKNRRAKKDIQKIKKLPNGWYLYSVLLQGNIELVFILTSDRVNDAYFQNLITAIQDQSDDSIDQLSFLGAFFMQISLTNPSALYNTPSGFQRRTFLRVLDEDEISDESRHAALTTVKNFLELEENNQFATPVQILETGWDLTPPPPADLPKLDHYLQYREILSVICTMFSNVDHNWATNNRQDANCFLLQAIFPIKLMLTWAFPWKMCWQSEDSTMTVL